MCHERIPQKRDITEGYVLPSITLNPDPAVNNKINTSNAVTHTPAINGQPKSNFNATALPITSAKSHAVMATSCKRMSKRMSISMSMVSMTMSMSKSMVSMRSCLVTE